MNKVVLLFSDTTTLSEFILKYRIAGIEVNSRDCSITGLLTDVQIKAACREFDAQLKISTAVE